MDGAASVKLDSQSVFKLVGYASGGRPSVTGEEIGVAVIDSGIGGIVFHQNFVAGAATTDDLYGHGLHVASILYFAHRHQRHLGRRQSFCRSGLDHG